MDGLEIVAIAAAGLAAGAINALAGSGTLVTFPVLLAFGYSPVVANVSNTIGLVPGSLSGAIGYRAELAGQRGRIIRYGVASVLGGITGAVALLLLPPESFRVIAPVFIAAAVALILLQPRLTRRLEAARRRAAAGEAGLGARAAVFIAGTYGGYFGAAQGILLIAVLSLTIPDDLQRLNALKNVLALLVNGVAALVFVAVAEVAWGPAAVIAAGAIAGGQLGSRYGRRLPDWALRGIIVVVGLVAIVQLVRG